nr:hypothetical protein [Tanacetum cinerariifolium]
MVKSCRLSLRDDWTLIIVFNQGGVAYYPVSYLSVMKNVLSVGTRVHESWNCGVACLASKSYVFSMEPSGVLRSRILNIKKRISASKKIVLDCSTE